MKPYTIERYHGTGGRRYMLLNPSGEPIAAGMSWRTARRIADALNTVRWQS